MVSFIYIIAFRSKEGFKKYIFFVYEFKFK